MLLGYAQVSTDEQTTRMQLDSLQGAGCERTCSERPSDASAERLVLGDLLSHVRAGDTVVVWRLDRLGRSLPQVIEIVQRLKAAGVGLWRRSAVRPRRRTRMRMRVDLLGKHEGGIASEQKHAAALIADVNDLVATSDCPARISSQRSSPEGALKKFWPKEHEIADKPQTMQADCEPAIKSRQVIDLTREWGDWTSVSLYLDRCQVDTPNELVKAAWDHVALLRSKVGKVLDLGAGDARFAVGGNYHEYVGYEIDADRCTDARLPTNAKLLARCAFSDDINDADLCIGNPPFVRNQDLPAGWRETASQVLHRRLGISVSGLANAWQYFFLQSLASLKDDGLCVLIIPFEWVSRPSARALRDYIVEQSWEVNVYRLVDTTFDSVLTTSSITIVDKSNRNGHWNYFEETAEGAYSPMQSASGSQAGVIEYVRRSDIPQGALRAVRGLSPGTQKVLTLTEGERVRSGLAIGRDVVPCVTTLRTLPGDLRDLDEVAFKFHYRAPGQKCWLIRTNAKPSAALTAYLSAIPAVDYQTATCLERETWWAFKMPPIPEILMAQSFKGEFPKGVRNTMGARAVGGVSGIYNASEDQIATIVGGLDGEDLRDRVVAHSNGLRKIEINQLNTLLLRRFGPAAG